MSEKSNIEKDSENLKVSKAKFVDFDSSDVVNQNSHFHNEFQDQEDNKLNIFTTDELKEILRDSGADLMRDITLEEKPQESMLIRKEDAKIKSINIGEVNEEDDDFSTEIPFEELRAKAIKFQDFVQMPKLAGAINTGLERNIVPQENIEGVSKYVDVFTDVDSFPEFSDKHNDKTVEIIRNNMGEIESLKIVCKCGEITIVSFDYTDEAEEE